ncbi:hypothetical protein T492DRAFT_846464 [Pavlovales sp. CCMP2436]|nr:hypothetical protein T492DRAFT_846464 [Pavlovales sp. CCMP2436]
MDLTLIRDIPRSYFATVRRSVSNAAPIGITRQLFLVNGVKNRLHATLFEDAMRARVAELLNEPGERRTSSLFLSAIPPPVSAPMEHIVSVPLRVPPPQSQPGGLPHPLPCARKPRDWHYIIEPSPLPSCASRPNPNCSILAQYETEDARVTGASCHPCGCMWKAKMTCLYNNLVEWPRLFSIECHGVKGLGTADLVYTARTQNLSHASKAAYNHMRNARAGRAQVRYELAPHRQRAAFFESLGAHLSRHLYSLTAEDALPAADASNVEPSTRTLIAGLFAQCDDEFADLLPQSTRRTRPSSTSAILGAMSLPKLHGGKEPALAAKFAARAAEELAETAVERKRAREAAAQTQAVAGAEALRRSDPVEAARREMRDARMAELEAEYDDDAFE